MPELTVTHIVLLVIATVIGAVAGWALRADRATRERAAVSAGWQEQAGAQRKEQERLLEQNKSLMEQVGQYRAANAEAQNRAGDLSAALQEAFGRRDELQHEIRDIRSNLEVSLHERERLAADMAARDDDLLRQKDERIARLGRELESWQSRVSPLVERFRARSEEAGRLAAELASAKDRIRELEQERLAAQAEQTRIEAVHHPEELTDGLDASNDPDEDEPGEAGDAGSADGRDDLKLIKGVGPAIEKTLNELGIFSFRQIADLSEYDIDRVARKLKGFHSRIYREDWIGQARGLLGRVDRG